MDRIYIATVDMEMYVIDAHAQLCTCAECAVCWLGRILGGALVIFLKFLNDRLQLYRNWVKLWSSGNHTHMSFHFCLEMPPDCCNYWLYICNSVYVHVFHVFMIVRYITGYGSTDCIGCFPILPYLRKFQFSLSLSTSTKIKVKITTKIKNLI